METSSNRFTSATRKSNNTPNRIVYKRSPGNFESSQCRSLKCLRGPEAIIRIAKVHFSFHAPNFSSYNYPVHLLITFLHSSFKAAFGEVGLISNSRTLNVYLGKRHCQRQCQSFPQGTKFNSR